MNTNQCEIFATLSLPHKGRLGWITSNEYIVSENDGDAKTFTIFNHDNTARNRNKKLGVYLTRYDKKGVFVISYLKVKNLNQRERLSTDGLMVHYVPYAQPKVSELLDLTPNSIRSNSERPSDPTFTDMHDAGDGAIGAGKRVNVSNLFRIQVLNERVESGQNNNSVRFKITPLTCPTINLGFSKEDFVYERVSNNDPCIESFSESWNLDNDSKRIARINGQSLGYGRLAKRGGSLKIPLDPNAVPRNPPFRMRRVLQTTYGDGKNMWLGYLLKANQIKNGHVFVCPNNRFNHAIGKRFGNILGINNTSVTSRSLTNGETVFLVAKYELNRGPNDNVYLWVNPNLNNEPRKQNAISFIKNTNIGSIT